MRTFQYSDVKSHKFWNIEVSGTDLTVTYGKVGSAGQTQTKTFASAKKAQAEADKLIREKLKKGYVETTPVAAASEAEAFVRALAADPDDEAGWHAFADYLAERGEPRGEFMQVQIALENESLSKAGRDALKKEEARLLKKHQREWLGPLAACTVDAEPVTFWRGKQVKGAPVAHRFARGWLSRLAFHDLTVAEARALAQAAQARLIRELVVEQVKPEAPVDSHADYIDSYYESGPDVPADLGPYDVPGLHALCRCPHLGSVRVFRLGEGVERPDWNQGNEYYNCHTPGQLAHHLVKQMPNLEELYLLAHQVDANKIFALPMPKLRVLQLYHSYDYPLDRLAANKSLTNLTTLLCHPHALEYDENDERGAYIRLAHLRAVCRSQYLKSLTTLQLRLTNFGDEGAKEIVESGILKRLRVLDLQGGCITDEGAKLLAGCPDLKNLEFLNLRLNALTKAGENAIKKTGVKADVSAQHGEVPGEPGEEIPEYLFEGDIE
jgi:uncharacterized protein (TIGR02996 family)